MIYLIHKVIILHMSVLQQASFPSFLHVLLTNQKVLTLSLARHHDQVLPCKLPLHAQILVTQFV